MMKFFEQPKVKNMILPAVGLAGLVLLVTSSSAIVGLAGFGIAVLSAMIMVGSAKQLTT